MEKIILVNPNYSDSFFSAKPELPVGLGYIAQVLSDTNADYKVFDLNFQTEDELFKTLAENDYYYIAFSLMSFKIRKNYELINKIKKTFKSIKVIIGGPHALAAGEEIFQECSGIDILVQGEGEEAIVGILKNNDLSQIGNILYKNNGNIIKNERNKYLDINSIKFPKYEAFDLSKYNIDYIPLASSRGCVYKCAFCGARKFLGSKNRRRTSEKMFEEFKFWQYRGYKKFCFSDSLFAINKKRIYDFCNLIIEGNFYAEFIAEGVRADNVDIELLQIMKRANFNNITFGVESASNKVLDFYNKGETIEQIEEAIINTGKIGIATNLFFILGAPDETKQDMKKTLKFPQKFIHVRDVYFFQLTPIIGTPYYDYLIKKNFKLKQKYPDGNFGLVFDESTITNGMSPSKFEKIFNKGQRIATFIRNRHLLRQRLSLRGFEVNSVHKMNFIYYCFEFIRSILKFVKFILYNIVFSRKKAS
jgi:radical SAM superfamily enzyme YgiQ (UPF0313 family)